MTDPLPEDVLWLALAAAGAAAQAIGYALSSGRGELDGRERRILVVWGGGFLVALLARALPRFRDADLPLRLFEKPGTALVGALVLLATPLLVRMLRRAA